MFCFQLSSGTRVAHCYIIYIFSDIVVGDMEVLQIKFEAFLIYFVYSVFLFERVHDFSFIICHFYSYWVIQAKLFILDLQDFFIHFLALSVFSLVPVAVCNIGQNSGIQWMVAAEKFFNFKESLFKSFMR